MAADEIILQLGNVFFTNLVLCHGAETGVDYLPKIQARKLYQYAQERKEAEREARRLRDLEEKELAHYNRDLPSAQKLLSVGESKFDTKFDASELAAWTTVASTILNLDETISKE